MPPKCSPSPASGWTLLLLTLTALLLAFLLAWVALPTFERLLARDLSFDTLLSPTLFLVLFGVFVIANTAIGVVQEFRAKRTLDRLQILITPTIGVHRDGALTSVAPSVAVSAAPSVPDFGDLAADQHLVNRRTGSDERFHGLVTLRGKEQLSVDRVPGGEGERVEVSWILMGQEPAQAAVNRMMEAEAVRHG